MGSRSSRARPVRDSAARLRRRSKSENLAGSMANRLRNNWAGTFFLGLVLICVGAFLFLSLLTYDPTDIPKWAPLLNIVDKPVAFTHNIGGLVGALLAGYALFFLGAAAYLLSTVLLGYGIAAWTIRGYSMRDKAGWGLLMVVMAACILGIQSTLFRDWHGWLHIDGAGGWLGEKLGRQAIGRTFGPASAIFLAILYLVSLVFAVSTHPLRDVRYAWKGFLAWREARRAARLERMDAARRMDEERKALEKEAQKLERKLKKKEPAQAAPAPAEKSPEPEIIDATAPAPVAKKPKLSELNAGKDSAAAIKPGLTGLHLEGYELPGLDLLDPADEQGRTPLDRDELLNIQGLIIDTLQQFGIRATPGTITKGPTITRYEVYPDAGVRVDKIVALERDIARATRAERINILAPIPGKDTVGIEIANSKKVKVTLRELFEKDEWRETSSRLPLALGMDVYGHTIIGDLAKMPHCLVAGTTGSGKSVCINAIIASLLFRYSPEQLRFIMIDPKVVEMQIYNSLPHLITPVVTDSKKVLLALRWVVDEMELRYRIFAKAGVKNITAFNDRPLPKSQAELDAEEAEDDEEDGEETEDDEEEAAEDSAEAEAEPPPVSVPRDDDIIIPDRMPFIVVIVDELADLMQTAPADVESAIARITQMARAAGIHMIVATQTPRADVVTGIIKANIPSRIAFQVASKIDSRVILDENGAEKLLGQGDMLYLPPGTSKLSRAQGVLVTEEEIRRIVEFVSAQAEPKFDTGIHEKLTSTAPIEEDITDAEEELVSQCLEIIRQEKRASTSMLQRRLRLGYTRAARVIDILEQRGIVGPKDGAKDREILVDLDETQG